MLLDFESTLNGWQRTWKCLGCGREVLQDREKQAEDDRMRELIRSADN